MTEKIEEFNKLKDELESYANKLPSLKDDVLLSIFERIFKLIDNEKLLSLLTLVDKFYENLKSKYVIQHYGIKIENQLANMLLVHNGFRENTRDNDVELLKTTYELFVNKLSLNNTKLIDNTDIKEYLFDNFFNNKDKIKFVETLKIQLEQQIGINNTKYSTELENLLKQNIDNIKITDKFTKELKGFKQTFNKIDKKLKKFKKVINASTRAYWTCAGYLVLSIISFGCAYWTFNHFDVGALFKNDIVKLYNKQPLYIFLTFIIYKLPTTLLCIIGLKLLFTSIKYENEGRKYKSLYTYIDFFNDFEKDEQKQVLKELSGYFFANDNDKKGEKTFAKFLKKIQLNINSNK